MKFLTKAELYEKVDKLIEELDLTKESYPLDSVSLAQKFFVNAEITYGAFDGLCAILYRGRRSTSLKLNSRRSKLMQNFDCMHEIIHYFLHTDIESFQCISPEGGIKINDFLEWQANEGAAEALVPYRLFIPMYVSLCEKNEETAVSELSKIFGVTNRVILNRIDNLSYEIYQYKVLNIDIESIELLSKKSITRKNISFLSAHTEYCARCHNEVADDAYFCPICGNNLLEDESTKIGIGTVSYDSIDMLPDMRAISCPVCGTEDFVRHGYYCHICGTPVANRCTNSGKTDINGAYLEFPCDGLLDGDARFCPICGSESTFLKAGLLKKII